MGMSSRHTPTLAPYKQLTCHRNIGVIITTVGEVVTVDAHQCMWLPVLGCMHEKKNTNFEVARAYAVMPFVWCVG